MATAVVFEAMLIVDASLRVDKAGEGRLLLLPLYVSLMHWSVNRFSSKYKVISVVQVRKEAKELA